MLHGEAVVLTDMLDCRERRSCKQEEYRNKYHTTVISFCMNIPSPVKTNPDISKVFQSGVQDILSFLQSSDIKILESTEYNEKTGNELLLAIDSTDSKHIKNAMAHIEETHPLGRLFDIDVINPDGIKMSRNRTKNKLIHRHILHLAAFRHCVLTPLFLAQKKCTPCLISWTYADRLHTFFMMNIIF